MPMIILAALALVLHLVIAVVLIRKYLRTRDVGFVWLGVAVVAWPLISDFLRYRERVLIDVLVRGHLVGFYPFTLVERGQLSIASLIASLGMVHQLVEIVLLLVAVFYLYRTKGNNNFQAV